MAMDQIAFETAMNDRSKATNNNNKSKINRNRIHLKKTDRLHKLCEYPILLLENRFGMIERGLSATRRGCDRKVLMPISSLLVNL